MPELLTFGMLILGIELIVIRAINGDFCGPET